MCKPIAINEERLNAKGRPLNPLNPLGKFYANLMPILRQNAITKSVFFNMGWPPSLTMFKKCRIRGTSLIIVGGIFERCLFDGCIDVRVNVWDILRMPSAFHESQGVNKVDPALEWWLSLQYLEICTVGGNGSKKRSILLSQQKLFQWKACGYVELIRISIIFLHKWEKAITTAFTVLFQ